MNLTRLRTLVMVARSGSISKAALDLHLTQPAVTKHIQSLEEYYGKSLIDRSAREAVLTEEGRLLYRYALEVLRLMDEAETALAKMSKTIQGSLRIGASSIPGQYTGFRPRINLLESILNKLMRGCFDYNSNELLWLGKRKKCGNVVQVDKK